MIVRKSTGADLVQIDALLAKSYPKLLRADYPPSVLVTAIPLIAKARPSLVQSGTYYVAEINDQIVGAGGWTAKGPMGESASQVAHIRHFVADPDHVRRGIASAIITQCFDEASAAGHAGMACYSTRTAVPFYVANGFTVKGEFDIELRPGIVFPSVAMVRQL